MFYNRNRFWTYWTGDKLESQLLVKFSRGIQTPDSKTNVIDPSDFFQGVFFTLVDVYVVSHPWN